MVNIWVGLISLCLLSFKILLAGLLLIARRAKSGNCSRAHLRAGSAVTVMSSDSLDLMLWTGFSEKDSEFTWKQGDALSDATDASSSLQNYIFHSFRVLSCKPMQRQDMRLFGLSHFQGLFTREGSLLKKKTPTNQTHNTGR